MRLPYAAVDISCVQRLSSDGGLKDVHRLLALCGLGDGLTGQPGDPAGKCASRLPFLTQSMKVHLSKDRMLLP